MRRAPFLVAREGRRCGTAIALLPRRPTRATGRTDAQPSNAATAAGRFVRPHVAPALRADDRRRADDAPQAAVHRLRLHARQLGPVLGGPARARQRQHRHAHHAERELDGNLRRHGPAQRDRDGPVGHDRGERRHLERPERHPGPDGRREVERPQHRLHERRRDAGVPGGLGERAPDRLHAGLHADVHRLPEQPRLGPAVAQLPGEAGLVRRGDGGLHLARHGDARPAGVLHGRPALPDRPGGDAGRDRLHVPGRLLEARPATPPSPSRR